MLSSWSKLYRVFACCSALVATAEENVCCEELCTKMNAVIDKEALLVGMSADTWFVLRSFLHLHSAIDRNCSYLKKENKF